MFCPRTRHSNLGQGVALKLSILISLALLEKLYKTSLRGNSDLHIHHGRSKGGLTFCRNVYMPEATKTFLYYWSKN